MKGNRNGERMWIEHGMAVYRFDERNIEMALNFPLIVVLIL